LLPLAVWFFKLPGLLAGMALIAFGIWLYSGQTMRLETRKFNIKINYIDICQEFAIFPNFSLPVIISGIIPVLVFWIAKTILLRTPGGYAQLGIFTATEQWLIVLAFIPGQMANVSQPILSSIYATRDTQRFRKAVVGNIVFPVSIAILFGLVIIAFSRWIPKLYGDNYSSMASIMLIMCIVGILRVFGGAVGTLLVTINKMWPSFWINLIWGSVLIVSMILLAPLGARGLALSNALAYGVHALLGLTLFLYLQQTLWKKE
jgi:O-antigen/teichoic acid export membrane protein